MSTTEGAGERGERRKLPIPRVPSVSGVAGISRRQQYSAATRRALLGAAGQLFALRGYAATSLDAIVAEAKVTKGALYHHFSGKQGIFEAVLADIEEQAAKRVTKALKGAQDPWEQARAGLSAFLDVVREPAYSRVVVHEAPNVLGYDRMRDHEGSSAFAVVRRIVGSLTSGDELNLDAGMQDTLSRIFYGALAAAGDTITASDDPGEASQRVDAAFGMLLDGMRSLVARGGATTPVSGS